MAEFFVKHSLNPNKAVKFNITLRYFVVAGEEGEHMWVLEVGTTYPSATGGSVPSGYAHMISLDNFDQVIEETVSKMCQLIDWSPFVVDGWAPTIEDVFPTGTVKMPPGIWFTIKDKLPSAGIDLSDMKVFLNNSMTTFEITDELITEGDPYEYNVKWYPKIRVYNTYD